MIIEYPSNGTQFKQFTYPAGETQVRLTPETIEKVKKADKICVIAKELVGEIMPLALLTDALHKVNSFAKYSLELHYLPYSRADRRFVEGDCFALKVFGNFINDLCYDEVLTLDVHSDKAFRYINNLRNFNPNDYIKDAIEQCKWKKLVILLPDKGSITRYKNLPGDKQVCDKIRDPETGILTGFRIPDKKELNKYDACLIVDDICDGGGTFVGLAKELSKQNPTLRRYLYVTHGIFSKGLDELFLHFSHIYTTDSFQNKSNGFVTVL